MITTSCGLIRCAAAPFTQISPEPALALDHVGARAARRSCSRARRPARRAGGRPPRSRSASIVMLPSYSTLASVTVARWILDLSMVRITSGPPVGAAGAARGCRSGARLALPVAARAGTDGEREQRRAGEPRGRGRERSRDRAARRSRSRRAAPSAMLARARARAARAASRSPAATARLGGVERAHERRRAWRRASAIEVRGCGSTARGRRARARSARRRSRRRAAGRAPGAGSRASCW